MDKRTLWNAALDAERAHDDELTRIYGASAIQDARYDIRANGARKDAPGNLHSLYEARRVAIETAMRGTP